jgi:glyoxylase I family protein
MPQLKAISHVELTVSDSERAATWWQNVMGFTVVRQLRGDSFEGRVMVPSVAGVCIVTHDGTQKADAFDEQQAGLDHLSFRVADSDQLQRWVAHLDENGVVHSGIIDAGSGPTVVLRDPDNMQLDLYVHSSAAEPMLLNAAGSA